MYTIQYISNGEVLESSESFVGLEDVVPPKKTVVSERWAGEKPVKKVVWESVQEFTNGDVNKIFSPKDISQIIIKKIRPLIKVLLVARSYLRDGRDKLDR